MNKNIYSETAILVDNSYSSEIHIRISSALAFQKLSKPYRTFKSDILIINYGHKSIQISIYLFSQKIHYLSEKMSKNRIAFCPLPLSVILQM